VNGIVDMGVYSFQKALIDGVIESAFVRNESCKDMEAAWRRFGTRMVPAVKELLASPPSVLPLIDSSSMEQMLDEDTEMQDGDSVSSTMPKGLKALGLEQPLTASDCINPALITGPAAIAALSASIASMEVESQITPCMHAAGDIGISWGSSIFGPSYQPALASPPMSGSRARNPDMSTSPATSKPALTQPVEPVSTPAEPIIAESLLGEPIVAGTPPAQVIGGELSPPEPVKAESPPAEPIDAESPPAEPIDAESPPAEPLDAESPPAEPLDAESPPAEPIDAELPPAEPIDAESPPAQPIEADSPAARTTRAVSPSVGSIEAEASPIKIKSPQGDSIALESLRNQEIGPKSPLMKSVEAEAPVSKLLPPLWPMKMANIAPQNDVFDDSDGSNKINGEATAPGKRSGTLAARNKKAVKSKPKSAAIRGASSSAKKHRSRRPLAKDSGDHQASKRQRSQSLESEDPLSSSPAATRNATSSTSRPVPKKRRLVSPSEAAPMIAAFPPDPVAAEGDIVEYSDLLQATTESSNAMSDEPAISVGPRKLMKLDLPTAVYDAEVNEVRLETQAFCFPYEAVVWLIIRECIQAGLFALSCAGQLYWKTPGRR